MLRLPDLELPEVELQLAPLENVAIRTADLARTGADDGKQTTGLELGLEQGVNLGVLLALLENALDVVGLRLRGGLLRQLGTSVDGLSVLNA